MFEARPIAAAENVDTDRQFIATELGLHRILRRINVDQLDDEVLIRAGSRGEEVCNRRSFDFQRRRQLFGLIRQHVWAAIDEALIADQPRLP